MPQLYSTLSKVSAFAPSGKVCVANVAISCWALLRSIKELSACFSRTSWPQIEPALIDPTQLHQLGAN